MRTRLLALLGAIVVALSLMPGSAFADDVGDMSNHVTTYEIHADGSVSVKSTMSWRFKGEMESIYFTVPRGIPGENELSGVRIVAPNGQEPKTQMNEETGPEGKRVRRYEILAKDFPIASGPWTVEYTLSNLLVEYQDQTAFTWRNLSPDNPLIRRWEATITTPWQIDQVHCTVNGKETCHTEEKETSVTFSGGEAPTGTDVVIQVATPTTRTGHSDKPQQPGSSSSAEVTQTPSESDSSASASPSGDSTDDSGNEKSAPDLSIILLWIGGGFLVLIGVAVGIVWLVRRRKPDNTLQYQQWQGQQPYPQQQYPPQRGPQYPQQGPGQPPQGSSSRR